MTKWTRGALLPSSAFFFLLFLGDGLGPPGASPHAAVPPSAWRECLPVLGHGKKTHPPATAPQQHLAFFPVTRHSHAFFFFNLDPSGTQRRLRPGRLPPHRRRPPQAGHAGLVPGQSAGRGRDGGDVSFERGRERERERERERAHTRPRMPGEREREKTRGQPPHTPFPSSLTAPKPSATGGGTWWPACGPGGRP